MKSSTLNLMNHAKVGVFGFALVGALQAHGQLFLNVGTQTIQPNTSGQVVSFFVSNAGTSEVLVRGLNFNLMIGDGGAANGGSDDAPAITDVDITSGTPFSSDADDASGNTTRQMAFWSVIHSGGSVSIPAGTSTKVGSITLDSTGFVTPGQSWDLFLSSTPNGPTEYLDPSVNPVPMTITDGTLQITPVPEPAHIALASGALLFGFAVIRRFKNRPATV